MEKRKVNWEKLELDPYEQEIEDNIEKAKPVEDEAYWKELIVRAAENTVRKRKRLTLEFKSEEAREKAIKLLKEKLGEEFRVVQS